MIDPIDGSRSLRASKLTSIPGMVWVMRAARSARRLRGTRRPAGVTGWLRLDVLGLTVMIMASIALMHLLFHRPIPHYAPGVTSMFAGLLLTIGSIRAMRPFVFWEGAVGGMIHIGLGFALSRHAALAPPWTFLLFCFLLLASAGLRSWIALVEYENEEGSAWLLVSSAVALFCLFWLLLMRGTGMRINLDLVLSIDLMILGLAILALGTSRRLGSS